MLVTWKLDRLGRNLKHLIIFLDDLQALGVAFVSLGEGIDATTPAGKLQMHILGAIAEFERGRIVERVRAGLARAKAQGTKLGRRAVRFTESPARGSGAPVGPRGGQAVGRQREHVSESPMRVSTNLAGGRRKSRAKRSVRRSARISRELLVETPEETCRADLAGSSDRLTGTYDTRTAAGEPAACT